MNLKNVGDVMQCALHRNIYMCRAKNIGEMLHDTIPLKNRAESVYFKSVVSIFFIESNFIYIIHVENFCEFRTNHFYQYFT